MAYDSDRHVMVMFGGNRDNSDRGATNDTWELIALDLPLINEHPASQYRLAGETATFSVSAVAPTFLSYQWYRGSTPIPGATGSTFVIANVQPADADEYSVRVSNACGEKRSRSAILTLDPKLHIFTAENTTTLIWPAAANVVLESAEIVIGPWSVVPNASSPFAISTFGPAKFFRLREVE